MITWWGRERRRGPECPLWFAFVLAVLRLVAWAWCVGLLAIVCLGWQPPLPW